MVAEKKISPFSLGLFFEVVGETGPLQHLQQEGQWLLQHQQVRLQQISTSISTIGAGTTPAGIKV